MSRFVDYGIDLGTTNSCIARCEGSDIRIFQNNDQMNVTPSVVQVLKSGRLIVGKRAYNAIVDDPENIKLEFKRWMGQKDTQNFPASGRVMTAEELSAEILKSLKEDVRRQSGEEILSAVITVPAAFDSLQCEATARAAKLAGLQGSPLLQEPIAAAVAYGATPDAKDQRWLVFDLGGGTLDIAVISTRNGRLSVLEHRGNNLLGGKDMDRRVVEDLIIPALAEKYLLPSPEGNPDAYRRLFRRLLLKAEEAKIDLSTSDQVILSLFNIGEDQNGDPIEIDLTLERRRLEHAVEPIITKGLQLAKEALAGARISGTDLDRILLVGGPTQMPLVRSMLSEQLGAKVDYSLDPMTVVARGAALYASTVEHITTQDPSISRAGKVSIRLAYDAVCPSMECAVDGKVEDDSRRSVHEIKVDTDGGIWTSGWLPVSKGLFELAIPLQEKMQANRYWLYARDATGRLLETVPEDFCIRSGLIVGDPPLPHTISIEVSKSNGSIELDPIFPRSTPLPAGKTVRYRSEYTLRPSDTGASLTIKLWEGEELSDPEANTWIGSMQIGADQIRRPLPEGSEIELFVKLDTSRLITVEAFIPYLNQHLSSQIYMPEREGQIYESLASSVPSEVEAYVERLDSIDIRALGEGDDTQEEIHNLRREIEDLDIEANSAGESGKSGDPDQAKRIVEGSKGIRGKLSRLEKKLGVDSEGETRTEEAEVIALEAQEVVRDYGSSRHQDLFSMLKRNLDRAIERGDSRSLKKAVDELNRLRWGILYEQDWFWKEIFSSLNMPGRQFLNTSEAKRWKASGEDAVQRGDGDALREAVRHLWDLQPKSEVEADKERVLHSGLRRY